MLISVGLWEGDRSGFRDKLLQKFRLFEVPPNDHVSHAGKDPCSSRGVRDRGTETVKFSR